MDKIRFFLKIFIITFIVAGAVFLIKSSNPILSFVKLPPMDVKGASTEKAQKVTGEIASDIGSGAATIKNQVFNIKVGDIVDMVVRFQRVPQDAHNIQEYVKEQVDNVLKSKK